MGPIGLTLERSNEDDARISATPKRGLCIIRSEEEGDVRSERGEILRSVERRRTRK
jgi:hypothetical protein